MPEKSATVLVADDSDAKRYLLTSWLRSAGHQVVEASTGLEALGLLDGVELAVLDVRLPDLTGTEVCDRIKANPATASIPVIQVSAVATGVADRAYGLNEGADAYLAEPFHAEEFLATVTATLRYFRARRRAEQTSARLTALTRVTLAINAAETFDRLARTAAEGAAQVFGAPAAIMLVLPGSRRSEIARLMGPFGDAVARLKQSHPRLHVVLALAETVAEDLGHMQSELVHPHNGIHVEQPHSPAAAAKDGGK